MSVRDTPAYAVRAKKNKTTRSNNINKHETEISTEMRSVKLIVYNQEKNLIKIAQKGWKMKKRNK